MRRRAVHPTMSPLVSARMEWGMTQADVAERLDVTQGTISNMEYKPAGSRLGRIGEYADLVGMKMTVYFTKVQPFGPEAESVDVDTPADGLVDSPFTE